MSYFPIKWQLSAQSKEKRMQIAEKIITAIYTINIKMQNDAVVRKHSGESISLKEFDISYTIKFDEAIGHARLYIGEELADKIREIKITIIDLAKSYACNPPKEKADLLEFKKFTNEITDIVRKLKIWAEKEDN